LRFEARAISKKIKHERSFKQFFFVKGGAGEEAINLNTLHNIHISKARKEISVLLKIALYV